MMAAAYGAWEGFMKKHRPTMVAKIRNNRRKVAQLLLRKSRSYSVVSNSRAACIASYSRRGNFGSSLVHNMFLTYLPDGSRGGSLRGRIDEEG